MLPALYFCKAWGHSILVVWGGQYMTGPLRTTIWCMADNMVVFIESDRPTPNLRGIKSSPKEIYMFKHQN